jgi:hypothetical protein
MERDGLRKEWKRKTAKLGQSVLDVHPGGAGTGLGDGKRVVVQSPATFTFLFFFFFFSWPTLLK